MDLKVLGLVVAESRRPTAHPALWLGALDEAGQRGWDLVLLRTEESGGFAELAARAGVAGLLVDGRPRPAGTGSGLVEPPGLPVVWMNQQLRANCVHADERRAGRQAAELLLARGHRRIGYFSASAASTIGEEERRAGFTVAMRQARAEALVLSADHVPWAERMIFARAAARHPAGLSAFVAATVAEAALLSAALAEDGLLVPRDRALVAIDADPDPRFITVQIPLSEIGSLAVSMLVERLAAPGPRPAVAVPCMVVEA